jgi:hypothetical protein
VLVKLADQRHPTVSQLDRLSVLRIFGPGHPNFPDGEGAEDGIIGSKTGDVILMSVGGDDQGELLVAGFCDVIDHLLEKMDIPLRMHSAIDQNVTITRLGGERNEETVSKSHPVHPYPETARGGSGGIRHIRILDEGRQN